MPPNTPTLHLLCGKVAAGKSTLAAKLADADQTVLISEDDWLSKLYGDQMQSLRDYVRFSAALQSAMAPHVTALLKAGVSVVLDFPANTSETRVWMRDILRASGAHHELHLLTPPDKICIARMHARNAGDDHPFSVTEEQFHRISAYFEPPRPEEGFHIVHHQATDGAKP
ncbi:hypothetical protein PRI8871_00722 [Pseudoprimorskyibacter insulae]|uniref:Cell division protein ZipA n=2 Tax=Pseudoprimorskyibacter insulae TaxID=1695997 RepID=A0A2R8AQ01_9RHOB|nr:hypothetical protein PRI8871_00722 [Pseudoprimorskyibacter insulae]